MNHSEQPLDVLVVGAGLGGLSAAIAASQAGHRVLIVEQAPQLKEVGAGIEIAPNAVRLLERWGALAYLERLAVRPRRSNRRRWEDSTLLGSFEFGPEVVERYGAPYLNAHRADLHESLLAAALRRTDRDTGEAVRLQLGRRAVGVEPEVNGTAIVAMDDGERLEADLVIAADGVHSVIRNQLFGASDAFSGEVAYRAMLDADVVRRLPGMDEIFGMPELNFWLGADTHLVSYFVRARRSLNVVLGATAPPDAEHAWAVQHRKDELLEKLEGWDRRIIRLVEAAPEVSRWALFDRDPPPTWVAGRVCLLGDACHAMLPYQGQGAAQAMEDAMRLGMALSRVDDRDAVPAALATYERLRRDRVRRVQLASRENGHWFHMPDGPEQIERDRRLRKGEGDFQSYEWLWEPDDGEGFPLAVTESVL